MNKIPDNFTSNKYMYLLKTNTEDCKVEYFWYYFKEYVIRLSKLYEKPNYYEYNIKISELLNEFQTKQNYDEIYKLIRKYIINIVFEICKHYPSETDLIKTNIKRWNKIIETDYKIDISTIDVNSSDHYILLFYEIMSFIQSKDPIKFEEMSQNLTKNTERNKKYLLSLLPYLFKNECVGCLIKLNRFINIIEFIKAKTGLDMPNRISISKIIKKYRNEINNIFQKDFSDNNN